MKLDAGTVGLLAAVFLAVFVISRFVIQRLITRREDPSPPANVVPFRRKKDPWRKNDRDNARRRLSAHTRRPPRPRRKFLQIHPLVWLIGFAALASAYMNFIHEPDYSDAQTLNGRVSHVRDGDTIEVSGTPIRFKDLDCAELGTAAGERAKQRMITLAAGQRLECRLNGRRSYDRLIGECDLENGRNLSETMIREGYCRRWW